MAQFGRVLTAMVTPFTDSGALDLARAQELAKWLIDNGNDGIVVAGTTGESATLTHAEQAELIAAVVEAVDAPVIAGAGSNDTAAAIDLTEKAAAAGAAAILSVAPYYNRPSQAGLDYHFRAIAAATDKPVVLYDIPGRTGRKIATSTMLKIAHDVPNIVGVKDAAGNIGESAKLIAAAPDGFEVYSGNDNDTLPLLSVGAVGVIGVATHWAGKEIRSMIESFFAGDVEAAKRMNQRLLASWDYETNDEAPNPVPTKAMMKALNMSVGDCRPPMGPEPHGLQDKARQIMADLGRTG